MSGNVSDNPQFLEDGYLNLFDGDCLPDEENSGLSKKYYGRGISPSKHPLNEHIHFANTSCGNCKSKNVKVIYAQWSVHPMSGDAYWDYEIHCEDCSKFTSRSFAEN